MDTALAITVFALGIAFVANIFLGSVVLLQSPKKSLNQAFFALTLAASLWVLTNLLFAASTDHAVQYPLALLSYGAAAALALFFVFYCFGLAHIRLSRTTLATLWSIGLIATCGSMLPGVVGTGVVDNKVVTNAVPLVLYGCYLLAYMLTGIGVLIKTRHHTRGIQRGRITIVLLGLAVAALVGLYFNLALPMMGNYDFVAIGPVATFILAGSSTYAIVRHGLFDVKLAAVRTIAYAGTLLTLALVYYLIVYLVSTVLIGGMSTVTALDPLNIFLALTLAFLFQPVKKFYDKLTKDIFYRDAYGSSEFFTELSRLLVSTTELRGMLEQSSQQIATTFKAEQAFFLLQYSNTKNHHISAGTRGHARLPLYDARMLDTLVRGAPRSIVVTELLTETSPVRRMLESHRIALVMPLGQDDAITGYLMLGDHRGGSYAKSDLEVLLAVSNELVIAIQNALSLHELKELNATLQQRIDVATKELRSSNAQLKHLDEVKDEFMSMASHQLRTPLTSIKGYLSMVLDGDVGKISPQQRKVLTEAFNSSERMVHLISDFLNVSRLQTGKFVVEKALIDFGALVQQEVSDLQVMAKGRGLNLELKSAKGELMINADAAKLREVITNFIDNAIYYSPEHAKITVHIEKDHQALYFSVVDKGIGVPEAEKARLFNKFFRATNARKQRPDGTGVGLYLARKVITAHGGAVVFESQEGKGSTFGFRLPLAKSTK